MIKINSILTLFYIKEDKYNLIMLLEKAIKAIMTGTTKWFI